MVRRVSAVALGVALSAGVLGSGGDARAQAPRDEAASRFRRGLERFNEGDNGGALSELLRAQELAPHPAVLFNIGIVYAAMGRPVEAEAALKQSLAAGLGADLAARASSLVAEQSARIGELHVTAPAPGVLEIDGVEVAKLPLTKPLRLASGSRVVAVVAEGYAPSRREVLVTAGVKTEASFELVTISGRAAHLRVAGQLSGVEIVVDGQMVAKTPLSATIALAPGARVVELRRAGYATRRSELKVEGGATVELSAELDEAPDGPRGGVTLELSEPGAQVTVDGKPRRETTLGAQGAGLRFVLPPGEHVMRIERTGFLPLARTIVVARDEERVVRVRLEATAETRERHLASHTTSTRVGWAAAAAGVVLMGAGGYLYLAGNRKKDDAATKLRAYDADAAAGGPCNSKSVGFDEVREAECLGRIDEVDKLSRDGRTLRTAGLAAGGVGVVALGAGVVVLLSRADRDKYEPKGDKSSPYAWTVVPGREPAFVLSGRF